MPRPGQEAAVAAPAAGIVLAPEGKPLPRAGSMVGRGQPVLRFLIMPADKDPLGARADLEVKKARFDVAAEKVRRSEALLKDKAVSEKADQEAKAGLTEARAAYDAAQARWQILSGGGIDATASGLTMQACRRRSTASSRTCGSAKARPWRQARPFLPWLPGIPSGFGCPFMSATWRRSIPVFRPASSCWAPPPGRRAWSQDRSRDRPGRSGLGFGRLYYELEKPSGNSAWDRGMRCPSRKTRERPDRALVVDPL